MLLAQHLIYLIFALSTLFLLFGSYPLALIPPGLGGASYYIRIPSVLILTTLSIFVIAVSRFTISKAFKFGLVLFHLPIVYHIISNPVNLAKSMEFMGFFLIPLAFCLYTYYSRIELKNLAVIAFTLWLLLVVYGFINYFQGNEVIGITGNRNWMAISLLSLFPWSIFVVEQSFVGVIRKRRLRLGLALLVVTIPGGFLMFHCFSRAAWLAFGVFFLCFIVSYSKRFWRVALLLTISLLGVIITFAFKEKLLEAHENDIRIPTWKSTIRLFLEKPLLGVGPGNYTKEYAQYRAKSEYHRRRVAAELTTHPHNEFLHIAVNLGLAAGLCWLVSLSPLLFRSEGRHRLEQFAQFSAFVIYFHSMLDKPLVQAPSNIIGLCCLGVCWRRLVCFRSDFPVLLTSNLRRMTYGIIAVSLVAFVLMYTITEIRVGWHRRMAALYRNYDVQAVFYHYKKVVELDPNYIRGYYGAGAIALQKLYDPDLALTYLLEAARLDPDYAHLNRLIGKAYGTLRAYEEALGYFKRDCWLHPSDVTSYRSYLTCLAQVRNSELVDVDAHLRKLYVEKTLNHLSVEDGKKLAQRWLEALVKGDMKTAVSQANKICRFVEYRSLDPLFNRLSSSKSFSTDFLYARFNKYDYEYWRSLLFRRSILNEIQAHYVRARDVRHGMNTALDQDLEIHGFANIRETLDKSKAATLSVDGVFQYVANRISVQPEMGVMFELPSDVWSTHGGSSLAYSCLMSWLFRALGMKTVIYRPNQSTEYFFPVIGTGGNWYMLNWAGKGVIQIGGNESFRTDHTQFVLDNLDSDDGSGGTYQLFFLPQEFLVKNQLLSVLLQYYLPDILLEFDDLPTVISYETGRELEENGVKLETKDFCLQAPFNHLLELLNANSEPR